MSDRPSLRINYLLEGTELFGGVKVVLHHAELLRRLGHLVTVVSRGTRPEWYPTDENFRSVPEFTPPNVPEADLNIATFWTTVKAAVAMPRGQAVHFCQGFEADLEHNHRERPQILEAYSNLLPTFVVSPHLAELNRTRFDRPVQIVPPALEGYWRPRRRFGPGRPRRVLVPHPFEFYMKGVDTALDALRRVREAGLGVRVIRLAQWPLCDEERGLMEPDEFHHKLHPPEVASLLGGCDLMLAPSWEQEGFGLSVLEAMACGLPVVASSIPSHTSFAAGAAELVPPRDGASLATAVRKILSNPWRWWAMRRRGIEAAGRFDEPTVTAVLDKAVGWAATGGWRQTP